MALHETPNLSNPNNEAVNLKKSKEDFDKERRRVMQFVADKVRDNKLNEVSRGEFAMFLDSLSTAIDSLKETNKVAYQQNLRELLDLYRKYKNEVDANRKSYAETEGLDK